MSFIPHFSVLWIIAIILAFNAVVAAYVILPNIAVFRESVGIGQKLEEAGGNTWKSIVLSLTGFRTFLTGVFGAFALAIPEILSSLKAMDWSQTSLAQYSTVIGLLCIVGMGYFNSLTQKTAAGAVNDAKASS